MAISANLGFPRIGANRELKKALESFWKGELNEASLEATAKEIRATNWKHQQATGIAHIASGDFAYYDQVLNHTHMFGAIPPRYEALKTKDKLSLYFAMARGHQKDGVDVVAMEMTKWFDTNYHYIVPEFDTDTKFSLTHNYPLEQFNEAKAQGITTRPVVIGPVTFLSLGKTRSGGNALDLLPKLLPVYQQVLKSLKDAGAEWVQIDEPFLALDLSDDQKKAYIEAFDALKTSGLKIMLTTYFAGLRDNAALTFALPVDGVHIDLVREPGQLDAALTNVKPNQVLSLGVVNGRNIWKTNYEAALKLIDRALEKVPSERLVIAGSCSLLHSPVDLNNETTLDSEIKSWLAFAVQKLDEIALLTKATNDRNAEDVQAALAANAKAMQTRATSKRIHDDAVKARMAKLNDDMLKRKSEFKNRIGAQDALLKLPLLPTTTIGSFPQTVEIREARAQFKAGKLTEAQYDAFLEEKTKECIKYQVDADIDVPVHGEFERNDMVEYFGEQLKGYTFTKNGWVQSYGSRCVKPPVIFGDVSRPQAMTVRWTKFAQSLTDRPVKGMLTGPVTILQWSFVRDDQPREITCKQIALAIRDEVEDLEKAGIRLIQIDEPAVREGLPLRASDRPAYLTWAVDSFRLSAAVVEDATQIHTHMCYAEFNDIMPNIAAMDADVISIETSRSAMELLDAFVDFKYPNQIGPGVYDIHSPRVPREEEMTKLLRKALEVLEPSQVWVNPDCGLKTRGWKEVDPALRAMVASAKKLRSELKAHKKVANG
ncbi:MAG: 5-methyltetrahydropteroyltriglutamate--homocysteine S-methyltransferase [Alphaproteobacteria bacterium]|nr:5-methyltetrahydropteroyltriglutamate--homocysteine S-methyltransferase [Alphaproteobacteria bacterium]